MVRKQLLNHFGSSTKRRKGVVLTLGVFDGVHLGHQRIIGEVVRYAEAIRGISVVVTFHPHPQEVLKSKKVPLLIPIDRRVELIKKMHVDEVITIDFTKELSALSPRAFLEQILFPRLDIKRIFVGKNFHFGKDRKGDVESLKKMCNNYGIDVVVVQEVSTNGCTISSTKIREAIQRGEIPKVRKSLGRFPEITGMVSKGERRGRVLGYPTANVSLDSNIALPSNGVYAVYVGINNRKYQGMSNLGYRPTFNSRMFNLEVHIFDFDQKIYDFPIRVFFVEKMRDEIAFSNIDMLRDQLKEDVKKAREILNRSTFNEKKEV
ncbi:MAG: bifunctional riboflavin kinase/FAD synthetase [bacterium]|nr:bifunctional riboflavin kinase/FAD synthetase [bacterium]